MDTPDFEGLLKQTIGLDVASIGSSAIEHAVRARRASCNLDDSRAYWELLRASDTELQALIDVVVVPETWFLRDRDAFAALTRIVQDEWLPNHPRGILRLLSLPCSTGEEPYSLSMTLLDAGFPANRCHIDAIDISTRSLDHARRAIYGRNSFRGTEVGFRSRHFDETGHGHELHESLRRPVHFHHANLFAAEAALGTHGYDIIFCRNLLIYFDRATQDRAVQVLQRLLAPEGVLFVGPSETGLLLDHELTSMKIPRAFAFRKPRPPSDTQISAPPPRRQRRPVRPHIIPRPAPVKAAPPSDHASPTSAASKHRSSNKVEPAANAESCFDEPRRLADQGKLAEAAEWCDEHLGEHGASAELFQLLALIHSASGNLEKAAQYYRKALYLDQHHSDTLVHFAWLLEKQGDAAGARVLRGRVSRLEQKPVK